MQDIILENTGGFLNVIFDINTQYNFVPRDLFVLIIALIILGTYFKGNKYIKDEHIPIMLLLLSIVCSPFLVGFNVTALLQGVICWGISVAINQTYKQYIKSKKL